MNRAQRLAILTLLDKEMLANKSWCGETHLQKAIFVLQELLGVKVGYDFILYKHGPFSFEVRDDLSIMRAEGLLDLVVRHLEYGPSYLPTEFADKFIQRFPRTVSTHKAQVKFAAKSVGNKNVNELERIATALFIRKNSKLKTIEKRVKELVKLKPHISESDARTATREVDLLTKQSRQLVFQN